MLKQLPFRKDYLLLAGTVFAFLICYQLAFKKTVEAWQIHRQLNTEISQAADLSYQPAYLERKSVNLGKIISLYNADTVSFRSTVISTIAAIADKENVKLSEVPLQDPLYHTDKFIIEKLAFEGDFFSLIKVLNQLRTTRNIGMVRAVIVKTAGVKSTSDNLKKLMLEVYVETVK
ncbi:MAG: hypothetical protein JWP45_2754 [Mucilaginibacter sp.]|nr:hypothetical protein [Mucilaginibacter sp.]